MADWLASRALQGSFSSSQMDCQPAELVRLLNAGAIHTAYSVGCLVVACLFPIVPCSFSIARYLFLACPFWLFYVFINRSLYSSRYWAFIFLIVELWCCFYLVLSIAFME